MIQRIYVNNFRCFENFSIDFEGRSSLLVIGKNGSGKSTFRAALEIFQSLCRGSSRVRELIKGSDFTQNRTHIPMRFEVDLSLKDKNFSYTISFEFPANFKESRVLEEELSVDGVSVYSRKQALVTLAGGPTFSLDWHIVALPVIVDRSGTSAIEQLKAFFASMVLISPIPSSMSGFSEQESVELQTDAGNVTSWLNALLSRYPSAYNILLDYLKFVIPDIASFENVPRGEKGKQLVVKFENEIDSQTLPLEFSLLSSGEKCYFIAALLVASNKVSGPVFCFWDEPDHHLAIPEIGHLIVHLRKELRNQGQFIATSHHPETIRTFADENTFVFSRKSHLEPTFVRLLEDLHYNGDLVEALIRNEIFE